MLCGLDIDFCCSVMGETGTGKSTVSSAVVTMRLKVLTRCQFINLASGSKLGVNNGLRSMTRTVQTSDSFELSGRLVTLIDTPGFDDTNMSDSEILNMIAVYLETT